MSKYGLDNLQTEPVHKLLVNMSFQTTLSLMLYSIYTLTNTFFLARGVNAYAAGGVTLSLPVMMILGAVSTTVGTGGASIISRSLGQNDKEKAAATAANSFLIFWLSAIVVAVLGLIFLDPLMRLLGADEILMPYAKAYARIIFLGTVTSTGFSAIIRAEGNTRFSLYIWVFPVIVNLICDPLFIFVFNWGVEGAAAATVLAQSVSAGMSVYYFFFSKREAYKLRREHFKLKAPLLAEITSIGSPSLISQVSMSFFITIINQMLSRYGNADAITAFGIATRIQSFLIMPQNGIVQGMQPIVGYNYAAKAFERVRNTISLSLGISAIYGILIMIAGLLFAKQLVGIFVSNREILRLGALALALIALSFPFKGVSTIVAAVFQAQGRPFSSLTLLLTGIFAVQIPALILMSTLFSLKGIWLSFLVSDAVMCSVSCAIIFRSLKKIKKGEITNVQQNKKCVITGGY